jgi:hypothetical protein
MHTADSLVPEPSPFEVGTVMQKVKRYELTCIDQILAEMIQAGGKTQIPYSILHSEGHYLKSYFSACQKILLFDGTQRFIIAFRKAHHWTLS